MTDAVLNIPAVHFQPWVGDGYSRQARRILIVGESHYVWPGGEVDGPEFTRNRVRYYLAGHRHQFWTRTTKLLTSAGSELSPDTWNRLAYYIYVQDMLAKGARPTDVQWARSADALRSVLARLKPDAILILGIGLWSAVSRALKPVKDLALGERFLSAVVRRWRGNGDFRASSAIERVLRCAMAAHRQSTDRMISIRVQVTRNRNLSGVVRDVRTRLYTDS